MVVAVVVTAAALVVVIVTAAALVVVAVVVTAAALVPIVRLRVQRPVETSGDGVGLLLVQQGDRLRAHTGSADSIQHVVQSERGIGAGKRDLLLLRDLQREPEVLDEVLDHEAGLVIAVERLGRELLHHARRARTTANHLTRLLGVQTALLREGEGIRHTHHGSAEGDLVRELSRLALAGAAEAEQRAGERLDERANGFDVTLGGADDRRERAGDRTGLAAGNGAIEGVLAAHLRRLGDIARQLRGAGRQIDEVATRLRGGEQAVARQIQLLDILRITDHGEHHVSVLHRQGGAVRPHGTAVDKALGLRARTVVDAQGVTRIEQVAGDGRTHDAGADEGDLEILMGHICS